VKTFIYDLHVHTREVSPCGKVPAEKIVHLYNHAGYSGLVITDHFYGMLFRNQKNQLSWQKKIDRFIQGYIKAKEYADRINFTVLLGLEIRFPENNNDYLVYGADEKLLRKYRDLYNLNLDQFYALKNNFEKEILIYQAHPFRSSGTEINKDSLDGLETYNGNPRHESNNKLASNYAEKHGLKMISGSDFHRKEDLARGGITVNTKIESGEDLVHVLKNNEYKMITE